MSYLTLTEFRNRTTMPAADVDAVESAHSGWIAQQLSSHSRRMDSQLRKRYSAPFESPYPEVVMIWLAQIVTPIVYLKRGVDPEDAQFAEIAKQAEVARAEVAEAADSVTGLYDLPLRADTTGTGISKGGPLAYSESHPYEWTDVQADYGRGRL